MSAPTFAEDDETVEEDDTVGTYTEFVSNMTENSLPVINLTSRADSADFDFTAMDKTNYQPGRITIAYSKDSVVAYNCNMKYRGATSYALNTKRSFAIKLVDEADAKLKVNLFGIRKNNSWIMDGMVIDRSRLRNRVCFDLWNKVSKTPYETDYDQRNGTTGQFVELFLNGIYWGLYCFSDKIDDNLLDIDGYKEKNGEVTKCGILYKGASWDMGCRLTEWDRSKINTSKTVCGAWELNEPEDYPSDLTWNPLGDLVDFNIAAKEDSLTATKYKEHYYEQNVIDYAALVIILHINDQAYKNTYLSDRDILDDDNRFLITPWDLDASLGQQWDGSYLTNNFFNLTLLNNIAPYNFLFGWNIDHFRSKFRNRIEELCNGAWSVDSIAAQLNIYKEQITESGAWDREVAKWNGVTTCNKVNITFYEDLNEEIDYIISHCEKQNSRLLSQIAAAREAEGTDDVIDETEGIKRIVMRNEHNGTYDLSGRQIDNKSKGLIIRNGKLVLVK